MLEVDDDAKCEAIVNASPFKCFSNIYRLCSFPRLQNILIPGGLKNTSEEEEKLRTSLKQEAPWSFLNCFIFVYFILNSGMNLRDIPSGILQ